MDTIWSKKELEKWYLSKHYKELIEKVYPQIKKHGIRKGKFYSDDVFACKLLCSSLYLCGHFYDCLWTMKVLFSEAQFDGKFFADNERAHFVEAASESLLYITINNPSQIVDVIDKMKSTLSNGKIYFEKCKEYNGEKFSSIHKLFDDFLEKQCPYYEVSFFVPLVLNFSHYTFTIEAVQPYRSVEVNQETRNGVNGTLFTTTINGFVKADTWWEGPSWETRQKLEAATLPLSLVNRLLLIIAEGDMQEFMPRIRQEQLTDVRISQFTGSGDLYHFCDGTWFDGKFIKNWIQRPEYDSDELAKLNLLLSDSLNYPLYATLYHQAMNTMNAGLYEESIMLFFSCLEATVHYWCKQISNLRGLEQEYEEFESCKPVCINCSLYQTNPHAPGINRATLPPSIYSYPGFLKKNGIISAKQEKELTSLIHKAQNDKLRNDMMHGKNDTITYSQVTTCREAVYRINSLFISISEQIRPLVV